ncbi:Holliday junction endonuclease RuvC [Candidatus Methanoperedens nitroreducens]|uniref:Holliday junction endonuclease RuvC n=1 Tax=Candidatus Methanoperedens nitratireducens TaxID=1392998 RepID=A0A062V381_9EURY|nr:crossover junction endodeoxyribonuclease RuvC [Candidatus Methanoperedens nitroreducens]KCZ73526.1 Holliday junction endonuclease RuvC [Candidatus Methanoperedens nitroreducens]MDJ1422516.1 crossover junction endodeoxyribonuclease RuvC [Candidatus Methanoperedens sp.]
MASATRKNTNIKQVRKKCVNTGQSTDSMIVIGIDPGLATVGFGIIRIEESSIIPVSYGCISTSAEKQTPQRLLEIYKQINSLFKKYAPGAVAIEKLFFTKNVTNAMSVSEAMGVILLAAQQKNISVFEYTPNQIKQAITGSGRANKKQMQEMIKRLLKLNELPQPDDAADGLSIALCHIHVMR